MRRAVLCFLLLLSLCIAAISQDINMSTPTNNRRDHPSGIGPVVEVLDVPTARLSSNWVFVVDTSDSMEGIFHKALEGWRFLTQDPTDEWQFYVFAFSNRGMTRRAGWFEATPDDYRRAEAWVERPQQRGINSFGAEAIAQALRLNTHTLSVVLITDGGFTSACENRGFGTIRGVIAEGQSWRRANALSPATITSVGISNRHYSAWCARCIRGSRTTRPHDYSIADNWRSNKGHKPSDDDCQAFLREVGSTYHGGYLLVRNR